MKRFNMPRPLGAPKPEQFTYTLVDTTTGKVLLSCSDRELVEGFKANRAACSKSIDNLVIREETVKSLSSSMKSAEAQSVISSAMAHERQ